MSSRVMVSPSRVCRRCGLCQTACPTQAITGAMEGEASIGPGCTDCGLCTRLCPALDVNRDALLPRDLLPGCQDGPLGPVGETMVGRCPPGGCSDRVASGGAVTALLRWALESGFADGVVGVGMDPARPTRTQTHLAGSLEELNLLSGSCYQIASHGAVIPRLKNLGRRLIYVGLPCHIHALRKAQQLGLADNVVLAVGIFCGFNLLPEATDFLIRKLRRGKEEARRVEFRGGPWPGGFRVAWNSGRESFIAKDAYSLCDALFLPEFCNYCPDLAAELADVSFADAWYRPGGWSTVLTRSKMGRYCVHEASRLGFLLTGPALTEEVVVTQAHTIAHKKRGIAARLAGLPPAQRPVFSGFGLDTTPEGTWGAWYRWAPTLARQGFQLLPLACFKAASRISRRLVVHL